MNTTQKTRLMLFALVPLLGVLPRLGCHAVEIQLPSEAKYFLQQADTSARKGNVTAAIDSYDQYLKMLTVRDGRDNVQNNYRWILQAEITRARNEGGRADYGKLMEELTPLATQADEAKDPIRQWRLHLLMADIALQQDNEERALAEMDAAIAAYPDLFYPDPARQSSIQFLLNYAALTRAQKDMPAAIEWFLETFTKNPVCVYVELEPWENFFKQQGNPERFVGFYERVVHAFQKKLDDPALAPKHDSLRYFMRLFQAGLEQAKGRSGGA
ncbi:MAG: hypothetical protein PHF14_00915 [Verrucomicrobiota bacterium]|jgi:tetratricopeptide (TPR) repeat protein|nr:hypothetical protein [Verrucomicrobiota bacterium]MDD8045003.1 hypothetical protein [Verrucomicrobiota bacterium]MDD8051432.1 hypothetical protein [Verrucomicrobiota bacterium]MDI9383328.1 hypothetical protein [Verrucomicrobiota bacterium]